MHIKIIQQNLIDAGIDIVHPFNMDWYNCEVAKKEQLTPIAKKSELALLIANTKAVWPFFKNHLKQNPDLPNCKNPFESFVEEKIKASLELVSVKSKILFSHHSDPDFFPIQRLAHITGFAWLADTHLCVHPEFGPWISLRAVIQLDLACDLEKPPPIENPCKDHEKTCLPAFKKALENKSEWENWLALRQACPVGRQHEFSDEQSEYHYTKNPEILKI